MYFFFFTIYHIFVNSCITFLQMESVLYFWMYRKFLVSIRTPPPPNFIANKALSKMFQFVVHTLEPRIRFFVVKHSNMCGVAINANFIDWMIIVFQKWSNLRLIYHLKGMAMSQLSQLLPLTQFPIKKRISPGLRIQCMVGLK